MLEASPNLHCKAANNERFFELMNASLLLKILLSCLANNQKNCGIRYRENRYILWNIFRA